MFYFRKIKVFWSRRPRGESSSVFFLILSYPSQSWYEYHPSTPSRQGRTGGYSYQRDCILSHGLDRIALANVVARPTSLARRTRTHVHAHVHMHIMQMHMHMHMHMCMCITCTCTCVTDLSLSNMSVSLAARAPSETVCVNFYHYTVKMKLRSERDAYQGNVLKI